MPKKINKILIFEESELISIGFKSMFSLKSKPSFMVEICHVEDNFATQFSNFEPDLLLINPHLYLHYKKEIQRYRAKTGLQVIGIVYSYFNSAVLNSFDALIQIDDSKKQIILTIDQLSKNIKSTKSSSTVNALSRREKEVLKLLASGYASQRIAETLFISLHTVNTHRKNIMNKLDIKTVSGLTIYAVLNNIISLKEV